ncbi:TcfC E-set like domain-containing protein [Microbulbifer agarilyticus]
MRSSITFGLLALAVVAHQTYGATAFTLETAVPEGFSELTERQQVVADVYFGNRPVGQTTIAVDPHRLLFKDPAAVLDMLPDTTAPAQILELLKQQQPVNTHRLCRRPQQLSCGVIFPEEFGVIYDPERFRVDLFFSGDLLQQQPAITSPYLPESSSDIAIVQNLTATWTGLKSDNGESNGTASIFGQSILSFGESGLHSQWSASDDNGNQIYQLHWTKDFEGRAYSAGLIQPQGTISSFVPSPYLYGVEYRSSLNSRTDNSYAQGAPLEINMPVYGRVEIYKDNRLVHSELLEAGNQLLNTSGLPSGAYAVEIRTYDESGRPLAQFTQFFAKDSLLPAPGEWQWSVQAGLPARLLQYELLPEQLDDYFLQAGTARRLFDNTGLFASIAGSKESQLMELGGRWISEHLEISPSVLYASNDRSGHRLYALLKTPFFTMGASESRLRSRERALPTDKFALLGQGYLQRSANLSSVLPIGRMSLRYSERDRPLAFESEDFTLDTQVSGATRLMSLEFQHNFFRNRFWIGDLTFAHSDADGEQLTTASLEFRYRKDKWSHSARLRGDSGRRDAQSTRFGVDSNWNDGDRWAAEVQQQISGEVSATDRYLGSRTRVAGHRGYVSTDFDYRDISATGRTLNYVGSLSTNLVANRDGIAWGGERLLDSAVMVDINGAEDQNFEIVVNGIRRGYAKGGSRSVVNLPSFQSYDVSLRPLENGFYDFRETGKAITLYPGNVTVTDYDIKPLILVTGRIIRGNTAVANKKIAIGQNSAVTDEFGIFQMEMYGDPRRLTTPAVLFGECQVPVNEQESGTHWLNMGDIDLDSARCPAADRG